MIESVIREAHRVGAKVGSCGQAPSDHPEFAEFLVACGIDSMSISPDSFIAVKHRFPPYIVSGGRPVTRLRLITLIATGARRARLRSTSIDNYCPITSALFRSSENIDGSGYEVIDKSGSMGNAVIGDLHDASPQFVDWRFIPCCDLDLDERWA